MKWGPDWGGGGQCCLEIMYYSLQQYENACQKGMQLSAVLNEFLANYLVLQEKFNPSLPETAHFIA